MIVKQQIPMSIDAWAERIRRLTERLEKLLSSQLYLIGDVADKNTSHGAYGVYVIRTPDGSKVVYAGRTKSKDMAGRMFDHLNSGTASDLGGMLKLNPYYPQEKRKYLVQYANVPENRDRIMFEYFVISVLEPPFNK
jgi:hypothetical protein